jgi:glycosyltransferase involved in cell wall biosynthesis
MKILISAYACEPGRGSEPEVGWHWAREIARHHEVWVITRSNNRDVIESELVRSPHPSMNLVYVDLPRWARSWKRGQRGVRLYYFLWQVAALRRAKAVHKTVRFDLVHHLTFANVTTGALVSLLPIPFVWGPVGGGVRVPWRLARVGGARGLAYEALRACRRAVARYLDPLVRLTWRRAELILVQNLDTLRWLPRRHRAKGLVWPNTGFNPADVVIRGRSQETRDEVVAVTPGRLLHLKAIPLALHAIACVPNGSLRLIVVGDGPERRRLTKLVHNLGIGKRVTFHGWLSRPELFQLFSEADLLLFPSLHDEGGMVVVEAMAHGLVPIVLDVGGPRALAGNAGIRVTPSTVEETSAGLAGALAGLCDAETRSELRRKAFQRSAQFTWEARVKALPFIPR